MEQIKAGQLGLDCRYLNQAPQCTGWMDLTKEGGSGSFEIFWSGLWKLTTAATIPYYTGPYGKSPRGFGFVAIGANVDDFHRAATEAREQANIMAADRDRELQSKLSGVLSLISSQVETMAQQLTVSTVLMSALVVVIAVWIASFLTRRITTVVHGIRRFRDGELAYRLDVNGDDEMAQLNKSFNHMADSVEESFGRLNLAKIRAEEASRMKSEFLANMSHELRTPLNGILGFSELIRDEATDDETRENAEIIEKSSKHLLELVNSILDIAKIEAGGMTLSIQQVPLSALINEVASVHMTVASGKGLAFTVDVANDVPENIATDALRLRQVLHNLLNNALKFTTKGSVTLSVAKTDTEVVFKVQDTGPGIPLELQKAVFEKFRQGEAFLTRSHGGTGLGLTLASHLLDIMGGHIGLSSVVGEGSTFYFTIPLIPPAPQAAESAQQAI